MSLTNRKLVTIGILSGLFLSAIEISVVGTAAPRIAREIGALDSYSWLFTAYLLTATLSMPVWGRVADQLGRKKLFLISLGAFLFGSVLCGLSQNMTQLIIFRAIKGIGGGGIFPLAFTIIADIYPFNERAKIQGYLSGVWGVSSIIGPYIGGELTDLFGWRSIFFINLVPGAFAIFLIAKYMKETYPTQTEIQFSLKSLAAATLFVLLLLLALMLLQISHTGESAALGCASIITFVLFIYLEKTEKHPFISPELIKNRVFVMGCLTGFFTSMMVMGFSSFAPLLFQAVLGYTPTQSGELLVPFTVAWVIGSVFSTRLLINHHYRNLLLFGTWGTFLGFLVFMLLFFQLNTAFICATTIVMGVGMSFNYPIALITTQHCVPEDQVGFATSSMAWVRNIGTTIGTTVMGVTLSLVFRHKILAVYPAAAPQLSKLLKDHPEIFSGQTAAGLLPAGVDVKDILQHTLFWVFLIKFAALTIALVLSQFYPKVIRKRGG